MQSFILRENIDRFQKLLTRELGRGGDAAQFEWC